jgi:hypothetical protein
VSIPQLNSLFRGLETRSFLKGRELVGQNSGVAGLEDWRVGRAVIEDAPGVNAVLLCRLGESRESERNTFLRTDQELQNATISNFPNR